MKLQEITANIRLRSPWEAIDLGFAMVQTWAKSLYIPLAIVTFSIAGLLYLTIPKDNLWIAIFIFWWLKPLYDRLILNIISHKLFNNQLSSWEALKALPHLIWNTGFFQTMTFRRFSFSRGFNLPIWQLEQLRGTPRASRQRVLHLASHSQAIWITISLVLLEVFFMISLFILLILFLPEHIQSDFFYGLMNDKIEYKSWIDLLNYFFYVLVVTLVHPFYVASNFALYINRRTQLESWDLELDFRKLGTRLKNLSLLVIVMISLGLASSPSPSIAAETNDPESLLETDLTTDKKIEFLAKTRKTGDKSKEVIKEVMLTKDLNDKVIIKQWVKKKKDKKDKEKKKKNNDSDNTWIKDLFESIGAFISMIIEFGLWILIAFGLFLLFYFRDRWMHLFEGTKKNKDKYQSPEIMFGMDVRPESLPDSISVEAQNLWNIGKHREALSLLYRGALAHLISKEEVRLENSNTEGDVVKIVSKKLSGLANSDNKLAYFKSLTDQWKLIAYAHRPPNDSDMQFLFEHWDNTFDTVLSQTLVNDEKGDVK